MHRKCLLLKRLKGSKFSFNTCKIRFYGFSCGERNVQTMQIEEKKPPINKHISICVTLFFFHVRSYSHSRFRFFFIRRVSLKIFFTFFWMNWKSNDSIFNTFKIVQLYNLCWFSFCFAHLKLKWTRKKKQKTSHENLQTQKNWNSSMADRMKFLFNSNGRFFIQWVKKRLLRFELLLYMCSVHCTTNVLGMR